MNWRTLTFGERVAVLKGFFAEGLSFPQMAERFDNATKNSVLGFCYRIGLNRVNHSVYELPEGWGGKVARKPARRGPNTFRSAREVNNATDPATRAVVDAVNRSGQYTYVIAEAAGVDRRTISAWRRGRHTGSPFLLQCVREAVGL